MGLTQSINMASQALNAMQTAMTVVSNNIANVSTEGYHKLRTNFEESVNYTPMTRDPASMARALSGVQIASIYRYSNTYLQSYYWNENSQNSYLQEYSSIAANMENLVNELDDTGLSKSLSDFYTSVNALNDDPSDLTARQNFVSVAENLCSAFNKIYNNVDSLQESLVGTKASAYPSELGDKITDVNQLLTQIADINESILKTNCDEISSTTLLDKRDQLVTELSTMMNVNVKYNENNSINISIGNVNLVSASTLESQLSLSNSVDSSGNLLTKVSIKDLDGNVVLDKANSLITSGKMGAILEACSPNSTNLNFNNVRSFLNELATEFASEMNEIQTGDPKGDGTTPLSIVIDGSGKKVLTPADTDENIFVPNDGSDIANLTAANISVNSYFTNNPYNIAAARLDIAVTTNYQNAIGNNSNSTIMAESRTKTNTDLDNSTFETYLTSNISKVGYQIEEITDNYETQQTVLAGIKTKLLADTGVNLDEELSDMLKYQQAYKAAARVFNVCNSLIDVLLEMG